MNESIKPEIAHSGKKKILLKSVYKAHFFYYILNLPVVIIKDFQRNLILLWFDFQR